MLSTLGLRWVCFYKCKEWKDVKLPSQQGNDEISARNATDKFDENLLKAAECFETLPLIGANRNVMRTIKFFSREKFIKELRDIRDKCTANANFLSCFRDGAVEEVLIVVKYFRDLAVTKKIILAWNGLKLWRK
jgi:hypothetical protein